MNKQLIKTYFKEFEHWLNGGNVQVYYKKDSEPKWWTDEESIDYDSIDNFSNIIKNSLGLDDVLIVIDDEYIDLPRINNNNIIIKTLVSHKRLNLNCFSYLSNNLKKTIFEKVFIVINKIDNAESNRGEILKTLNNELKENHILNIPDDNKLFISALYEFQKEILKDGLDNLKLDNRENIGDDDLGILEKRIYTFASQEMTEIFINDKISNIGNWESYKTEYVGKFLKKLKDAGVPLREICDKKNVGRGEQWQTFKEKADLSRFILEKTLNKEITWDDFKQIPEVELLTEQIYTFITQ